MSKTPYKRHSKKDRTQHKWADGVDIYIVELPRRLPFRPEAQRNFIDAYVNDLGFSRPRSFDTSMYPSRGIVIETSKRHWEIYRRLRLLSLRPKKVFILLGPMTHRFFPAIEKDMDHYVFLGDGFHRLISKEYDFFSKACNHLGKNKEMWRM